MLVRVTFSLSKLSANINRVYITFGTIDQIASLEKWGFAFTVTNSTGVFIGKINIGSYASFNSPLSNLVLNFTGGVPSPFVNWKLYQERSDNHMFRPIYGVSEAQTAVIYRVTSNSFVFLMDFSTSTLSNLNFYLYPL